MDKTLDRRSFLKGALATAAGAVAATVLPNVSAIAEGAAIYTPGTYSAEADGFGKLIVTMTFDETSITDIVINAEKETAEIGGAAAPKLAEAILAGQTPLVDGISGASLTSAGVKRAAAMCVAQAKGVDLETILAGGKGADEEPKNNGEDWIGTAPVIDGKEVTQTLETDLLIVGAGNAGLAGAALASDKRIDFILAEKAENIQRTRHWFGAVNSKYTEEAGVKINKMQMLNELWRYSSGKADMRVMKMWVDESWKTAELIDRILTDYGYVCEFTSDTGAESGPEDAYDYRAPIQHYYSAGPDCPEEYKSLGRNGVFADYIKKAGHDILFNHQLVVLEKEDDKVVGGIFKDTVNGNYVRIRAKNVLLTTGGYPANFEMLAKRDPLTASIVSLSYYGASDTGDGIKAGAWAGAALDAEPAPMIFDRGLVAPGVDAGQMKDEFGNWCYAGTGAQWNPTTQPFLKVNRYGVRVYNEESPYNNGPFTAYNQPGRVLCQIFDNNFPEDVTRFHTLGCSAQTRQQLPRFWGTDGTDGEIQQKVDAGIIMKADTLEELADKLGFEGEAKETFLATIDHYNALFDAQEDDEFGKSAYRLSAIRKPPFFGSWFGASLLTTGDGLRINEKAQVLAAGTMKPIEGLYAAGDCSGSFFANNYPELFPGVAVGRSMTEALKAVRVITGEDK